MEFLKRHSPFQELDEPQLLQVATSIDVGYFQKGAEILRYNEPLAALHIIRSGAVETFRRNGDLYNRLSEGGIFGEQGLLRGGKVRFPATAFEDTLIYFVPAAVFQQLFDTNEFFADYIEVGDSERRKIGRTIGRTTQAAEADLLAVKISTLLHREPVCLASSLSVVQAAKEMTEQQVSCLLLLHDDEQQQGKLAGIVTDRDIRSRFVAAGLSADTPVSLIMTTELVTIDDQQYVFDAMMLMLRNNVHHLPVLKRQQPIGVVALPDIIRYESQNSLYVVSNIFRQSSAEGLAALNNEVRACFLRLVNEDANSQMIGAAMAAIGRSIKQRLLELAEQQFGPPPVPYCFLALGSMARDEQLMVTDQDNALILDDSFDPHQHDAYFLQLAQYVSDGLAACGYSYCSGDIMATNTKWRQPLRVWQQYFTDWIEKPTAERLLHSGIFFDLDAVWGQTQWAEQLKQLIAKKAPQHPHFLACMTRNALQRTPPLGFFKDFVMESDGRHNNSVNIKRRGTAPMVDLVRVHALAMGSTAINTFDRLLDIINHRVLPKGRGEDLRDAYEVIALTRIRQQALSLQAGEVADNNVVPERLSEFERKHLKEAFSVLSNAQKFLKFHFRA